MDQTDQDQAGNVDKPVVSVSKRKSFSVKNQDVCVPKPGENIRCRIFDAPSMWKDLNVLSRAGKRTGKNRFIMNVSEQNGDQYWLDFQKSVLEWTKVDQESECTGSGNSTNEIEDETETVEPIETEVLCSTPDTSGYEEAKTSELLSWKENHVYETVADIGQSKIKTRWIYTEKNSSNGIIKKARLVAKGFQDPEADYIRNDSPTCSKESLRIVFSIISSMNWE